MLASPTFKMGELSALGHMLLNTLHALQVCCVRLQTTHVNFPPLLPARICWPHPMQI